MAPLITVVEDDHSIAAMYKMKLELSGFRVNVAYNGKEALDTIKEEQPDLILLDLMMPVMPGDEMLKELRATDWGSKIKVIVLTNISKSEAPMGLRFLNVDRYIVKAHYTPQQVVDTIQEVIGKNR